MFKLVVLNVTDCTEFMKKKYFIKLSMFWLLYSKK